MATLHKKMTWQLTACGFSHYMIELPQQSCHGFIIKELELPTIEFEKLEVSINLLRSQLITRIKTFTQAIEDTACSIIKLVYWTSCAYPPLENKMFNLFMVICRWLIVLVHALVFYRETSNNFSSILCIFLNNSNELCQQYNNIIPHKLIHGNGRYLDKYNYWSLTTSNREKLVLRIYHI
jgi:hypothetical protein